MRVLRIALLLALLGMLFISAQAAEEAETALVDAGESVELDQVRKQKSRICFCTIPTCSFAIHFRHALLITFALRRM